MSMVARTMLIPPEELMNYHLKISMATFANIIKKLARGGFASVRTPAWISRLPHAVEFLVGQDGLALGRESPSAWISWLAQDSTGSVHRQAPILAGMLEPASYEVTVALGLDEQAGLASATCQTPFGPRSLVSITVVGPGMRRIYFGSRRDNSLKGRQAQVDPRGSSADSLANLWTDEDIEKQVWSRTIGALGEVAWNRMGTIRWAILGCGRSGSLVAASLAHLNARYITLIDPDTLEHHNLGEMDLVRLDQVGMNKAQALATVLESALSSVSEPAGNKAVLGEYLLGEPIARPVAVGESLLSLSALVAVKRADILICCVDNPAARLGASVLAKFYLKPIVDIGTGILNKQGTGGLGRSMQMGADIRLVLPDRCLLCSGGIGNLGTALSAFADKHGNEPLAKGPNDWRRQRAGSLRSLNQVAVGLAMRTVEDFIAGGSEGNTWAHLEIAADGGPRLEVRVPISSGRCPLCSVDRGGDAGVEVIQRMFVTAS
jgi:hypothetical protein